MLTHKTLEDGLEYLEIINNSACANIALQGAHIFHYARREEEPVLWLSDSSDFEEGKAIRGGVPICWPSFGNNNTSLPQHGFARVSMFTLISFNEMDENSTELILRLQEDEESLKLWRYKFTLEFKITISDTLEMELITTNNDNKPFKVTQALHTYFNISDISEVKIEGLKDKPRFDALRNETFIHQGSIKINEEFDSVFQETSNDITLLDTKRQIEIKRDGSNSVVVWNPWKAKCERMSGMGDDAYKGFVCIESANAYEDFKIIQPNKSHRLYTKLSII